MASRLVAQALAEQSFTLESDVDYSDLEFASLSFESAAMEIRLSAFDDSLSLENKDQGVLDRVLAALKSAWQKLLQGLEKLWNWIRGNGWKLNKQLEDKVAKAPESTPEEKAQKDLAKKAVETQKASLKISDEIEKHKEIQKENISIIDKVRAIRAKRAEEHDKNGSDIDFMDIKDINDLNKFMMGGDDTKTPKAIADSITLGKTVTEAALTGKADAGNVEAYAQSVKKLEKLAQTWGADLKVKNSTLKKAVEGKIEIPEKRDDVTAQIKELMDLMDQAKP
jgi:hypothetical protein